MPTNIEKFVKLAYQDGYSNEEISQFLRERGAEEAGGLALPPVESPGFGQRLRAFGRFGKELVEDLVVSPPSFLGGIGSAAVASKLPPASEAQELFLRGAEKLLGIAEESYNDVVDAQAELISQAPEGLGGQAALATSAMFVASGGVAPTRAIRSALGLGLKGLAVYGAIRGRRGLKRVLQNMDELGAVPDASRTVRQIEKAVDQGQSKATREVLSGKEFGERIPTELPLPTKTSPVEEVLKEDELLSLSILREIRDSQTEVKLSSKARRKKTSGQGVQGKPPPADGPDVIVGDPRKFGQRLLRRYDFSRSDATIESTRRAARMIEEIPDVQHREDLIFFMEKTGNPYTQESFEQIAKKLSPKEVAIAEDLRGRWNALYDELNDINLEVGDKPVSYLDNWLHHVWKNWDPDLMARKARTTFAGELPRRLDSYEQGIQAGFVPRTRDIAALSLLIEQRYADALAVKRLLGDLGGKAPNMLAGGKPAVMRLDKDVRIVPEGYHRVSSRILSRQLPEGEGPIVVHDSVFQPLRNILLPGSSPDKIGKAFSDISAITKRLNFFFTLFHAYTLSESAINALGPFRGPLMVGRLVREGGAIPTRGMLKSDEIAGSKTFSQFVKTRDVRKGERLATYYGVKVGAPELDLMRSRADDMIREGLKKAGPLGKPFEGIHWLQKQVDVSLWDRFHHPMKIISFNHLYDELRAIKKGYKKGAIGKWTQKRLQGMSDEEIGDSVATFINDEFGGQNFLRHYGKVMQHLSNPSTIRKLRDWFVSPDWNISSMRASVAALQLLPGEASNAARGVLGLRHWRNFALGTFFYANVINYLTSGKYIWQNDDPNKRFWHVDTGTTDDKGRKVYWTFGKQYKELGDFLLGDPERGGIPVASFLVRKMQPYRQVFFNQLQSVSGFETNVGELRTRAVREGRELDGVDYTLAFGQDLLESILPFARTQAVQGGEALSQGDFPRAAVSLVPLPASRGGNRSKALTAMAEAFREGDVDTILAWKSALRSNGLSAKEVKEIENRARSLARRNP